MIRLLLPVLALLLGVSAAPARSPDMAADWNGAEIAWRDIGSGIREATRTGKPVIMVFHAPWCNSCKAYRNVFKDKDIVAASRDFVMILIDADADKVANGAFAPDGTYVPRTIFLDSEGNVRSEIRGSDTEHPHSVDIRGPEELLSLMRRARPASAPVGNQASDQ